MTPPRHRKTITLTDIATEVGVSLSTASMALKGKGNLSDTVRKQVKEAAERLGYQSRQSPQTHGLVGLLMEELPSSTFNSHFFGQMLMGAESVLASARFHTALTVIRCPADMKNMLREGYTQYAGLLAFGGGDLDDHFLCQLADLPLPVVLVDNYLLQKSSFSVSADNYGGAIKVVQHLVDSGHSRIAMLRGATKYKPLEDRYLGYLSALARNGIPICQELVPERISHGQDKGYKEMQYLLDLPNPPTAVFACSDRTALRAIDAIRERGLSVPKDIAVAGFDDFPEASEQQNNLTSVMLPMYDMGWLAAKRLLSLASGNENTPYMSVLPTTLVIRESSSNREVC